MARWKYRISEVQRAETALNAFGCVPVHGSRWMVQTGAGAAAACDQDRNQAGSGRCGGVQQEGPVCRRPDDEEFPRLGRQQGTVPEDLFLRSRSVGAGW